MSKQAMLTVVLPVAVLQESPTQPRLSLDEVQRLAAAIKRDGGIHTPLLVKRINKDVCEVVDGHRRLAAAKLLGLVEVPCIVVDESTDVLLLQLSTDTTRVGFGMIAHGRAFEQLAAERGWSNAKIAIATNKDPAYVFRARDCWNYLPGAIKKEAEKGTLPGTTLFALAEARKKGVPEDLVVEVGTEAATAGLTEKEVRALLGAGKNGQPAVTKKAKLGATKLTITFTDVDQAVKLLRQAADELEAEKQ
jgi:ParB/RepB/Spo0J family partition protein